MIQDFFSNWSLIALIFILMLFILRLCIDVINDKELSYSRKVLWIVFMVTTPLGIIAYSLVKAITSKKLFSSI